MGTCITKYIETTFNSNMVAQYRKEKVKGDYKDLKWLLSAFWNLKIFFMPDFGGQEIPYCDCVNPEGALIFTCRSTG